MKQHIVADAAIASAPPHWAACQTSQEYTLHQLSPYIGKLKSIIARDLIVQYSSPETSSSICFAEAGPCRWSQHASADASSRLIVASTPCC